MMTQVELAKSMVEFLEWDKDDFFGKKDGFGISTRTELINFFFDLESDPPNPKGLLVVWNKLDQDFDIPNVDFWKSRGERRGCLISNLAEITPGLALEKYEGYGPDRCTAFYEAIDQLINNKKQKENYYATCGPHPHGMRFTKEIPK